LLASAEFSPGNPVAAPMNNLRHSLSLRPLVLEMIKIGDEIEGGGGDGGGRRTF